MSRATEIESYIMSIEMKLAILSKIADSIRELEDQIESNIDDIKSEEIE